ncbi:hypothetical protein BUALT_Bualt19G0047700 [Buddleja alternifolia]|uniref:DUF4283 domain-containing protein n=1 Tax=Buddleja alternifolia TaxID=168488 RepID=A0AAV6W1R7_9LAMI|nr:hypothetical protein BUALT_Bualt19G0047700 [Buddleja alternifolia]
MDPLHSLVNSTNLLIVDDTEDTPMINFEDIKAFTLVERKKVTCNDIEDNKFAFVFYDKGDFDKVLNMSPWSFRGQLVIFKHWNPDMMVAEVSLDLAPFWVQAFNIPVRFTTPSSTKIIGNMLGKFIKTDLISESQRWKKFLRIRVELDISKPLAFGEVSP